VVHGADLGFCVPWRKYIDGKEKKENYSRHEREKMRDGGIKLFWEGLGGSGLESLFLDQMGGEEKRRLNACLEGARRAFQGTSSSNLIVCKSSKKKVL